MAKAKEKPKAPIQPAYSYPQCCGQATTLGVYGWRCGTCGKHLAFRDTHGRTHNQIRLNSNETPARQVGSQALAGASSTTIEAHE